MAKRTHDTDKADFGTLLSDIVHDTGKLVGQQAELLRAEVREELRRAGTAAGTMVAGSGLLAAAGLLSGPMVVHLVHRVTRLPLWMCYAAVAGGMGAAGAALVRQGGRTLQGVQLLPPPRTAATARENLQWLQEQVQPGTP